MEGKEGVYQVTVGETRERLLTRGLPRGTTVVTIMGSRTPLRNPSRHGIPGNSELWVDCRLIFEGASNMWLLTRGQGVCSGRRKPSLGWFWEKDSLPKHPKHQNNSSGIKPRR